MKRYGFSLLCCLTTFGLAAQIPAPKLYFPLDGAATPVAGVMPVGGVAAFGPGQSGFGLAVTNPLTQLRAPITFHEGAEPGTGDWTLSFWARFDWGTSATMDNFRLFSKGGRSDSGEVIGGYQLFCRADGTFAVFFATRGATTRESFSANPTMKNKFLNNQWNHFVLMRRGDAMRLYLNGEYIAEKRPIAGGASGDYGVKTSATDGAISTQLSPEMAKIPNWGLDDVATWMTAL
ncbi:MAG: LamG domain-containing protein, partial [Verrucomicrobiota bacterium]|nr:LamG domain-containing protein [Verrucomicrobiota bacterium]